MIRSLLAIAAALAAAICAAPPLTAQDMRGVRGEATYLPRIALSPDAVLMVEALGFGGATIARARLPAEGALVPLPFALEIPAGLEATLRLAIARDGDIGWLSAPIGIGADAGDVDLGTVVLAPYVPLGFSSAYRCGARILRLGFAGEDAVLDTVARRVRLVASEPASGSRYVAPDDPGTWIRLRGQEALAALGGSELPGCVLALPEGDAAWTARGNEPFWRAVVADGRLTLTRPAAEDLTLRLSGTELTAGGHVEIAARDRETGLGAILVARDAICHDSMSGMPYPETVRLTLGSEILRGCGGDPRDLLTGRDWTVTGIDGTATSEPRPTLRFDRGGRVAGTGGCNRWISGYDLTGEGVVFDSPGATTMACAEARMTQERRFLDALDGVYRHEFDARALVLHGIEGPALRAVAD
jgi:heat shock protein HslJ